MAFFYDLGYKSFVDIALAHFYGVSEFTEWLWTCSEERK